jgi:heme exporter protein D
MLGIIGWIITIFVIWVYQMLILALRNTYSNVPSTGVEYAAVWLRCAIVLAPLAILFASFRGARSKLYRESVRTQKRKPLFKLWVVVIALPGILGGVGGCVLMSCLVTMAV